MEKGKTVRKPSLLLALVPILVLIPILIVVVVLFEESPHVALIAGAICATFVAIHLGHTWQDVEAYIIKTISLSMQACMILMIIGILIGTWIISGTVPTMIYYGLKIISPGMFLVATMIICSIVSIATGSSWSTAGTVGVALLGVGMGLGIPAPMAAGAIISGAYFGDKMSPLSDTTNLAPAMAGSTLFDHIGHMVYTTGPSYVISLVIFAILGFGHSGQEMDVEQISSILNAIESNYAVNPFMLIPPALVIGMVVLKIPAVPGLIAGIVAAALLVYIFQAPHYGDMGEVTATLLGAMNDGFTSDTGHEMVDELFSGGGIQSMMWTVSLILCAMSFGGVMELSGCLESIANAMLSFAKSTGSLVVVTIVSCIFINVVASDQYLAIVIPGRMYRGEFRKRGLAPKNLSRCLEDSGTITSPLIPWNTCGAFMSAALGVATVAYLPYCFLNLINPLVSIFLGYTGITMEKLPEEEMAKVREEALAQA